MTAAPVAIVVFDLFGAGSIIHRVLSESMTPEEYSAWTANGVVPGPWIVMPAITIFAVIPVSVVIGLIASAASKSSRSAGNGASTARPGRADPFLVAFTGGLAVLSVAAMWMLWAGSAP